LNKTIFEDPMMAAESIISQNVLSFGDT